MNQLALFVLGEESGAVDADGTARQRVLAGLPRWERFYVEKSIEGIAEALSAPIRVGRYESLDLGQRYRGDIILERLLRLMQTNRRHQEQLAAAQDAGEELEPLWRELAKDWQPAGAGITNWETCILLCEASLNAPLNHDATMEYGRAFAHCFGMARYIECFGREPINVNACRMVRYGIGFNKLPPLDDAELAWIQAFNARLLEVEREAQVQGCTLEEALFRAPVTVSEF